jgi:hypothetical protein
MKIATPSQYKHFNYVILSSVITAIITIILLEFFRILSPLALIENGEFKNVLTLIIYIVAPFILCFRILSKGTILEELFQGTIFAVITWLLWVVMIWAYLFIKSIFFLEETLIFSLDFILPLISLFFIYFIIGGVLGAFIHYIKR